MGGSVGVTAPDWAGPQSPAVTLHGVGCDVPVLVGEFRCGPDEPDWHEDNSVGPAYHLAFPVTSAVIHHEGGLPELADPTRVVLYDADQRYRRGLVDPVGDRSFFVAFDTAVLSDIVASLAPETVDDRLSFRAPMLPVGPSLHLAAWELVSDLSRGWVDAVGLESRLLELIELTLRIPVPGPVTGAARSGTRRAHRELVEDTRRLLYHRYAEPLSLADVARLVGASPYHLHRVFRQLTGRTIHTHREQLRLRSVAAAVATGEHDLAALAAEVGYSSHSHLTARFRGAFGVTPSDYRRRLRSPRP